MRPNKPQSKTQPVCQVTLIGHTFNNVGEFEGKPVGRCNDCQLTIVDPLSLSEPVQTITLAKEGAKDMNKYTHTIITQTYYQSRNKNTIQFKAVPFRRDKWLIQRLILAMRGYRVKG